MSRSGSRSRSPAPERRRRDRSDSGGRRSPAAAKARSPRRDDKAKAPIGKGAFGGYRGFDENEMSKTLFVANISDDADERDVQEMFVSFGFEVSEVSLPRSGGERGHRGYGFVHLVKGRDVDDAISKCHGHELKGRPLKCELKQMTRGPPRGGKGGGGGRRDSRGRGGNNYGGGRRDSRGRGGRRDSRERRRSRGGRDDSRRRR